MIKMILKLKNEKTEETKFIKLAQFFLISKTEKDIFNLTTNTWKCLEFEFEFDFDQKSSFRFDVYFVMPFNNNMYEIINTLELWTKKYQRSTTKSIFLTLLFIYLKFIIFSYYLTLTLNPWILRLPRVKKSSLSWS